MIIIWSGLGILVIPAVAVGFMFGSAMAGVCGLDRFSTSAGCFGAFCALWLLCRALYPSREQQQEFSTGGKVLTALGHSLFLVPAWLWRWMFAVAFVLTTAASRPGFALGEMAFFGDFESLPGGYKYTRHVAPPEPPAPSRLASTHRKITRPTSPTKASTPMSTDCCRNN